MWNRLASSTTTILADDSSRRDSNKRTVGLRHVHQDQQPPQELPRDFGAPDEKHFWQQQFDTRLDALGISDQYQAPNAPYRYEIYRGKTVPSPSSSGVQLDVLPSSHEQNPPQQPPRRDPRRLQHHSSSRERQGNANMYPSHHHGHHGHHGQTVDQVSPPSSPDVHGFRDAYMSDEVSPIDDDYGAAQQQYYKGSRSTSPPSHHLQPPPRRMTEPDNQHRQPPRAQAHLSPQQTTTSQPKTSIPMMRRERRKHQEAAAAASRVPRSNSDHSSNAGRASTSPVPPPYGTPWEEQASAGTDLGGRATPGVSEDERQNQYGMTTTIVSQTARRPRPESPSLGQRMRQLGKGTKPEAIENRPAWNGASGRETQVRPVHDTPNVAPLKVPAKAPTKDQRAKTTPKKLVKSPLSMNPPDVRTPQNTSSSMSAAARRFLASKASQKPDPRGNSSLTEPATRNVAQSYPSPSHTDSPTSPPQHMEGLSPIASPTPVSPPDSDKVIKRKAPPVTLHAVKPSTSSSVYSVHPEQLPSPRTVGKPAVKASLPEESWVQPPSRFSFTTYATSAPGSPRVSDERDRPPMPEPPKLPSVMDRRRPLRAREYQEADDDAVVISLRSKPFKFTGEETTNATGVVDDQEKIERPASAFSTIKALPPAPPEVDSTKDRVDLLSAKLNGLAHRRLNITRSIKQMTELMPQDNLLASADVIRKREEEKRKVEWLKKELAEIQQEEYELGLKLHRAYKRLERESDWEPDSLWVKRAAM